MTTQARICKNCGYKGTPKMPGSGYIELVLYLFYVVPGLLYSIWRRQGTSQNVCPACNSPHMVGLESPAGQEIADKYTAPAPAQTIPSAPVPPKKMNPILAIFLFIMGLGFVFSTIARISSSGTEVSTPSPALPTDKWNVVHATPKMSDKPSVELSLDADDKIQAWLDTPLPILYVACVEGKTAVMVHTGTSANPELGNYDQVTVRIRLDKSSPFSEQWFEASDHKSLYAPNTVGLAKRIAKTETMIFEFTPFNSGPATVTFSVKGLSKHLGEVAKGCGWKYP